MSKICCIFSIAAHYRAPIYQMMDRELGCDFYIGDRVSTPLKTMDYKSLKGFRSILHNWKKYGATWQKGIHKAIFRKYDSYIMEGDPSIISSWFVLLWARLTGRQTILWTHGWYGHESKIHGFIKLAFFHLATDILTYGDYGRHWLEKKGLKSIKMDSIYNSLDYDTQLAVRKTLHKTSVYQDHFGNSNPVLLFLGRIQQVKKLHQVIDAMVELNKKGIRFNFVCIGKDQENVNLKEYALKYGLEKQLWMYGPLYEETKKGELMYNADICVSPGNIGLLAMDAMMYGLPAITNDCLSDQMPEFEAISEGETGSFFQNDNISDLSQKILDWYLNKKNCSREEIASNCFKIMDEKYNPYYQISVMKKTISKRKLF